MRMQQRFGLAALIIATPGLYFTSNLPLSIICYAVVVIGAICLILP